MRTRIKRALSWVVSFLAVVVILGSLAGLMVLNVQWKKTGMTDEQLVEGKHISEGASAALAELTLLAIVVGLTGKVRHDVLPQLPWGWIKRLLTEEEEAPAETPSVEVAGGAD